MSRPYVDRLSDNTRQNLILALMYGPSLGALTASGGFAGGLMSAATFGGMAACFYQIVKRKCAAEAKSFQGDSAPAEIQEMSTRIARKFGIQSSVPVYVREKKSSSAYTQGGAIFFNKNITEYFSRAQKEFILTHEMAHIKAGDNRRQNIVFASSGIDHMAASSAGISLAHIFHQGDIPAVVVTSVISATGIFVSKQLLRAFNSRSMERRRDYEAVQVTGDLDAAITAITKLECSNGAQHYNRWKELFHTHPVGEARIRNMRTAYEDGIRSGVIASPVACPV